MTEKEILKKYHKTIEENIARLLDERNITDNIEKQNFAEGFREGFTIGFYKGIKEAARNMLDLGIEKDIIVQATGLSLDEIDSLS